LNNKPRTKEEEELNSLTEELCRTYEELTMFYRIGDELAHHLEVEPILSKTLEVATEYTNSKKGLVGLVEHGGAVKS